MSAKGFISSIQSMGTLDGPGIRFVAFLQGCNLTCGCCHNPETQPLCGGTEYTAEELVSKAERFKTYFGKEGGITLSGGEPFCQPAPLAQLAAALKDKGFHLMCYSGYTFEELLQLEEARPLLEQLDLDQSFEESEQKAYAGKTFVITGSLLHYENRDALKAEIESGGGKVAGSVSKKTDYLINNDIESGSSKNKKAKELGVPIITEDDYIKMFK